MPDLTAAGMRVSTTASTKDIREVWTCAPALLCLFLPIPTDADAAITEHTLRQDSAETQSSRLRSKPRPAFCQFSAVLLTAGPPAFFFPPALPPPSGLPAALSSRKKRRRPEFPESAPLLTCTKHFTAKFYFYLSRLPAAPDFWSGSPAPSSLRHFGAPLL